MKGQAALQAFVVFLSFFMSRLVHASDGSFTNQFLGNPLLALVALFGLVGIAFVYHRIRK